MFGGVFPQVAVTLEVVGSSFKATEEAVAAERGLGVGLTGAGSVQTCRRAHSTALQQETSNND